MSELALTSQLSAGLPHCHPVYHKVDGSPFQPGDRVQVVAAVDRDVADFSRFVGQRGRVIHLEYSCGCGQHYPDDPMVGVRLDTLEVVEFWKEELARAPT